MKEKLKPEQTELRLMLSRNLKRLRAAREISQERLAELAGFHRTYVSQLERMVTNVSIDNLASLAKALEARPAELMAEIEGEDGPAAFESRVVKKAARVPSKI
jgi:transcriptional regulator with XRE-family HTH domain